jgi:hypothetical protein
VVIDLFGHEQLLGERRRRTATLIPYWLSVSTTLTLHLMDVAWVTAADFEQRARTDPRRRIEGLGRSKIG